jgi:hypothetical protein
MLTPDTNIHVFPETVEFRTPNNFGCQVVTVWYRSRLPRLQAFSEWVVDGQRVQYPMSIRLDEFLEFSIAACAAAGKEYSLLSALQGLLSKASNGL